MKRLAMALIMLALAGGCGFFSMEVYYQRVLPRVADPHSGHIYPKNNHGVIVYYSMRELFITNGLFFGGAAVGLLGGLLRYRQDRRGGG